MHFSVPTALIVLHFPKQSFESDQQNIYAFSSNYDEENNVYTSARCVSLLNIIDTLKSVC